MLKSYPHYHGAWQTHNILAKQMNKTGCNRFYIWKKQKESEVMHKSGLPSLSLSANILDKCLSSAAWQAVPQHVMCWLWWAQLFSLQVQRLSLWRFSLRVTLTFASVTYSPNTTASVTSLCVSGGLVTQSCSTLCNNMDCSPPGSSVHGILQARILECVAIPFSRGSSQPRDWTHVSYKVSWFGRQVLYQ